MRDFAVGSFPQSVAVGDFNGDGLQDLATANRNSNDVSVLLGDGGGGFGAATNLAVGGGPNSVAVADFNGDGKPDLATANYLGSVSVLLNGVVPVVSPSPASADFGNQPAGTVSPPQSVVITNTGGVPLHVSAATITGPGRDAFVISSDECTGGTFQVGQSCSIHVRFLPAGVGGAASTLSIVSDAPGSPDHVSLSGNGTPASAGPQGLPGLSGRKAPQAPMAPMARPDPPAHREQSAPRVRLDQEARPVRRARPAYRARQARPVPRVQRVLLAQRVPPDR